MSSLLLLTALLATALGLIYVWLRQHYAHWRRRGVPEEPPDYFLGHMRGLTRDAHWTDINQRIYRQFRDEARFCGFYTFLSKALFVMDLELIKTIMVRDFSSFADRGLFHNVRDDPLTGNLLFLDGAPWRWLRQKLSPVFTSGKMKYMYPTMVAVGEHLVTACDRLNGEIEAKDLCARYTTDVIGTCAFGLECNSLTNPEAEFRSMGRSVLEQPLHHTLVQVFMFAQPALARRLRMRNFRPEVSHFFINAVRETIAFREREKVHRNDLMDLLIEMKLEQAESKKTQSDEWDPSRGMTLEQIAAQAMMFFLAGFDTSSTTMSFCLYELALNEDVQQELRTEIFKVLALHNQELTYECLKDMRYLDMVIDETLRKYPILPHLLRQTTARYQIPDSDLVLEPGTRIMIPVHSIHHDPAYYPEPEKFKPERFTAEAVAARHPFAYLPFGEGPRNCIGSRFGKMQAKIGVVTLLRHFQFSPTSRTQVPLQFTKRNFLIGPQCGVHLRAERLPKH